MQEKPPIHPKQEIRKFKNKNSNVLKLLKCIKIIWNSESVTCDVKGTISQKMNREIQIGGYP